MPSSKGALTRGTRASTATQAFKYSRPNRQRLRPTKPPKTNRLTKALTSPSSIKTNCYLRRTVNTTRSDKATSKASLPTASRIAKHSTNSNLESIVLVLRDRQVKLTRVISQESITNPMPLPLQTITLTINTSQLTKKLNI